MLNGGFIGFGRMGITHFSILNSHSSVVVKGVCDASNTMMSILRKYKNIRTHSDYKKMIEQVPLDFIVISTPTDSHTEIIRYALEHNIHVFCEKPFGLKISESKTILNLLSSRRLVNQIGYVNRFNEIFMEVKRLIDSGVLGEIKYFCSEMYGATVLKDSSSSWRGKRTSGGGCMYEFASHCIDLVVYLLGKPDRVAGSVLQNVYSRGVEDIVASTLLYNSGISGNVIVNWSDASFRKPTNIVTIAGTNGKIISDKHAYKIFLRNSNAEGGFHPGWNTRYVTDFAKSVRFYVRGNEFSRQLDYFIGKIEKNDTDNISGFADALKTDETMEMIIEDASQTKSTKARVNGGLNIIPVEYDGKSFWDKIRSAVWRKKHA